MKLFIFGLGFSCRAVVNQLGSFCLSEGGWIAATTRHTQKRQEMQRAGLRAHIFSNENPNDMAMRNDLQEATHLLISIAPGERDIVLHHHADTIRQSALLQWIGYFSTVGVYGDHKGKWVDETAQLRPVSKRSLERVRAEKAWAALGLEIDVPVALIRLAGIYGRGRNTFMNFKNGIARRIIKPGQIFNRIHVDDIGAMTRLMALARAGGVFNGSDDEPAPPQDVVEFAAKLMQVPIPPDIAFEDADLSPMGRSFYGEAKRVSNSRLKRDLGLSLAYPTYREALTQLWQAGNWDQIQALELQAI